jgi:hypothetical protein
MLITGERGPYTKTFQVSPQGGALGNGLNAAYHRSQALYKDNRPLWQIQVQYAPNQDPKGLESIPALLGFAIRMVQETVGRTDKFSYSAKDLSGCMQETIKKRPDFFDQNVKGLRSFQASKDLLKSLFYDPTQESLAAAQQRLRLKEAEAEGEGSFSQEYFNLLDRDCSGVVDVPEQAAWHRFQDGVQHYFFSALQADTGKPKAKQTLENFANGLIKKYQIPGQSPFQLDNVITGGEEVVSGKLIATLRDAKLQPVERTTLRRVLGAALDLAEQEGKIRDTWNNLDLGEEP